MARSIPAHVTPEVLYWARAVIRLPIERAADSVKVKPDVVRDWETGASRPSIPKARLLAKKYQKSFASFFLPSPPEQTPRVPHDFRLLGDFVQDGPSSDFLIDMNAAISRRETALEILKATRIEASRFTETASTEEPPRVIGQRLRNLLGIPFAEQRRWHDQRKGFSRWREAVESLGVLVFQTADIPSVELRAYSLSFDPLPIVVVNRKDAFAARSFSLLHELVHLMLRGEGICDLREDDSRPPEDQAIEVLCNAAAAECLIPSEELDSSTAVLTHSMDSEWQDTEIEGLARLFSSSREAILRRLLSMGRTTESFYEAKRKQYQHEYSTRAKSKGFVRPPQNCLSLLGRPLVRLILTGLQTHAITTSDAVDTLGVRVKHFPALARSLESSPT